MLTRTQALDYLRESGMSAPLFQHSIASEAVLSALAKHFGEDEQLWGITGLLHDLDYVQTHEAPDKHGLISAEKLSGLLPEEALYAIRAHNGENNSAPVDGRFAYALRCGETVTGLVITAALVRPTGIEGMQPSSLKKKMKDKAFAATVNRDTIRECSHLSLELDEFLSIAIEAIVPIAQELGIVK
jgi:putative nucleotidyltransferase with HDIG domain